MEYPERGQGEAWSDYAVRLRVAAAEAAEACDHQWSDWWRDPYHQELRWCSECGVVAYRGDGEAA
jgi:hypothetical protein